MTPGSTEAQAKGVARLPALLRSALLRLGRRSPDQRSPGERSPRRLIAALTLAALALAFAGWLGDRYFAHGITVDWYTQHAGKPFLVARTVEHRTSFFNHYRALARYVQNWNYERLGVPSHNPPIDAEIRARLSIPPGPARRIDAHSEGKVSLRVDGRIPNGPLPPGEHDLTVRWRQPPTTPMGMALGWDPAGSSSPQSTEIPRTALRPVGGSWPSSRKVFWALFGLSSVLLLWLVYWTASAGREDRRRRVAVLATIAVVAIGAAYRLYDYQVMPHHGENDDEFFAIFNGWSLIHEGTPRGWTPWPQTYGDHIEHRRLPRFGSRFAIVTPYFEHPPAMHLLVGLATTIGGAHHWLHARLKHARLVPIFLSLITLVLMIAVARRLFPGSAAPWLGALLYAALPTIALQSRVVKEEALLAPLCLGWLLCFLRWRDEGYARRPLIAAAILAGICTLTKVTGFAFVGALTVLVLAEGRWRDGLWAFGVGALVSSLLLVYAAAIDWDVFWLATANQQTRQVHWDIFVKYFDVSAINHNLVGRSWALYLWLAAVATIYRNGERAAAPLFVPLVAYLGAIALGAGNWLFGWYPMPLYLFLCIGAGKFLADLWDKPDLLSGTLFVVLLVMYFFNFSDDPSWFKQPTHTKLMRRTITLVLVGGIGPFLLAQIWSKSRVVLSAARAAFAAGMLVVVVAGGLFVANYARLYQTHTDFDQDGFFHGEEPMNNKLRRCIESPDPGDVEPDAVPAPSLPRN